MRRRDFIQGIAASATCPIAAHAQQGDYSGAVESLQRALELKPDVAEANGALGLIYLQQGKLDEAQQALQRELKLRPDDATSQQRLAAVPIELLDT